MSLRSMTAAALSLASLFQPGSAAACQCVMPRDQEARRIYIMDTSRHVFAGQVLSVRKLPRKGEAGADPMIEARVRIVKQIKGSLPTEITIISTGGDTGANCGFGDRLASAWARELPVTLALGDAYTKNGVTRYYASGCTSGRFPIDGVD